ncbi:MAG: hypothetical protein NC824_04245 [Candidatus Omnitrophica bacterium]|nr:hypothetical protein [Candidatus Omnitrophota bacterium]
MNEKILFFLTFLFIIFFSNILHTEGEKIGIVADMRFDKKEGIYKKEFQQEVWEKILKENKNLKELKYTVEIVEDEKLSSLDELKKFAVVIIPGSKLILPENSLDILKEFVKSGGCLIRDFIGPEYLDVNKNGLFDSEDIKSKDIVFNFWQEIAGTSIAAKPTFNLIKKIRATSYFPELTKNLPSEFVELDLPFKIPHSNYITTYYTLSGSAKPLMEAIIFNIPTKNLTDEGRDIEGFFPVVVVNYVEKGVVISLGINVRALYITPFPEIYSNLLYNILSLLICKPEMVR